MATVVNFIDTTLQAAAARGVNLPTADIQLLPSAPLFKVAPDGSITPPSITFTATLIDLEADLTFNATGAPLTSPTARSVTVVGESMTGSSVTVIASAAVNGRTYTKPCTVSKLQDGSVGSTTYTWIKYADSATGAGLSDDPTGKAYIGLAYNKPSPIESVIASDYTWSLIKGTDGQPGEKGADGVQMYTWIKYADYANGDGMYDLPTANTLYIGIAVNKTTATESTNPADYVWSRFKGDQGVPGPALYTWIKYADSAAGAGLSDDPTGKAYIGFAYNKTTAVESDNPADYTWSLNQGGQGVPGQPGKDGTTFYTWIKYSDAPDGTNLYDVPTDSTVYIGIAVNKATATESTNKADYTWSRFKGGQGVPGNPGQPGQRGTVDISAGTAGTVWSDSEATAAIAQTGYGVPQMLDVVTLYNQAAGFANTRYWNGSAWIPVAQVINGSLLVKNTVAADKIDTRGLSIKDAAGNTILAAGTALSKDYAAVGTLNSDLAPAIASAAGLSLSARGSVELSGNTARKVVGSANAWDSDVYSREGYTGGAYASAVIVANGYAAAFGLSTNPLADGGLTSIDYALHPNGDGALICLEGGIDKGALSNYLAGDVFAVSFDGSKVSYSKNGVVLRTVAATITQPLFFDSSFATPGGSLSRICFGPMTSNNFADVGGTTKPQDNATVGAPSGTMVGGTDAGLVASRAMNGDAAFNALPGITQQIADRLSKTSPSQLAATVTLATSGTLLAGTPDNGVYLTPVGLYCVQGGVIKVMIPITGDPTYAGKLLAAFGTFGAVSIAAGGSLSLQASSYNNDPGIWFGFVGGVPKFSIVAANGAKLLFDPSDPNPLQIKNANIANSTTDAFTGYLGGSAGGSFPNPSPAGSPIGFGNLTANAIGGTGTITYQWIITPAGRVASNAYMRLDSLTGKSVGVSGTGSNTTLSYSVTCIMSDQAGRTVILSTEITASMGTPT